MHLRVTIHAAALVALIGALGCGTASAADESGFQMPLGAPTMAPAGFVALCERRPEQCLSVARPDAEALSEVRVWAGQMRWAMVFQTVGIATTPAAIPENEQAEPPPAPIAPRLTAVPHAKAVTPQEIRALKDARRKRGSAEPSKTNPVVGRPAVLAVPSPPRPVAEVSMQTLEAVTRRINRAIRRSSDTDAYGREDVWVLPEGPRPSGDCEDYVLAKRRVLIEEGVDPAALSIAIVRTRQGEVHAVLLVATSEGEQVLDNLTPWVLPWSEAPYEWLERQAPGRPLTWVRTAV
ncbi:transglutaminase-like cysteine peptidase [Brevundimonas sp. NIBR11]|uniref:transglutaminase-like cysteine peptidase n=1 Tax=Brevundimonas sp. NIBR11 TaxID=3015999 RepID=UPI0022F07138|nr:transglutaminase-like cysteine peptidase [Brevundimonas sp. NIBR11]WGM31818.1 hypothetical protein KKHFBJBL_02067 [Brevundimonas sp. NIBR11]